MVVSPSASTIANSWRVRHITFLDRMNDAEYPYPVDHPAWPHEFAAALAARVEDNAIVFTDWGTLYPVLYVTHIEQGRTGIEAHETYPAGSDNRLQDTAVSYILANLGKRPMYFTQVDRSLARDYNSSRSTRSCRCTGWRKDNLCIPLLLSLPKVGCNSTAV